MGTSGFDILEDDAALDAYGEFIDQYNLGVPLAQIRQRFEEQPLFRDRVIEDNTPFWLGFALAQWECGALDDDVRAIAQRTLDENLEQEIWEEDYPARKKVLTRFLKKISVPNKKPRKRVKPRLYSLPFQTGDCLVFRYADGLYGAAVALDAPAGKHKYAGSIIATTRIHQSHLPTPAEVAASHVMMKGGEREPAVGGHTVYSQETALEAQALTVVGRLEVTRTFGERLYGHSFAWNLEFYGDHLFPWEAEHPDSPWKLRLPIASFIQRRDDDWGQLGEAFARLMSKDSDRELDQQRQKEFADLWRPLATEPQRTAALEFLADYTGGDLDRIGNWVKCYFKG